MPDKDRPNRSANMEKAEGERWSSEQNVVPPDSESSSGGAYHDDGDNAGGITNRPLDEEVENQQALPERGKSQREERSRNNEDVER